MVIQMKKKIGMIVGVILVILIFVFGILYLVDLKRMDNNEPVLFSTWGRDYTPKKQATTGMDIVLSLEDEITENSVWCGTFNLIWNDLKNELVKQDIVFENQTDTIANLNKGTFTQNDLSEESYYKVYGTPSPELKEKIEQAIKQKFNEECDILNNFDFENADTSGYFLYSMLKKEFEFPTEFTKFDNGNFKNYSNVRFFGIDGTDKEETRDALNNQIEVLYHSSNDSFAVKLYTKQNDEIIIAKGNKAKSFKKMYENILERAEAYTGPKELMIEESLKIPYISFNVNEEIPEVENQEFLFSDGSSYEIEKAMQSIEFELDEKGGKVKSESGILANLSASSGMFLYPRQFVVDDTFTIFLVERGKEHPYFAAQISDISKVQDGVTKENELAEAQKKVMFEPALTMENMDTINVDALSYIELTEEAEQIEDMIYGLEFTKETCDGIGIYNIVLDNGESYRLEIYDDVCHIVAGGRGEAVLTKEQSDFLKGIIEKYSLEDVSLEIKEKTLTNTGATIVITDTHNPHYTQETFYRIDKSEYGDWKELSPITDDYAFTDIAMVVGEDNTLEENIDWSKLYGKLDAGRYRIVKRVYDNNVYKYFVAEFEIK